MKNYKWLIFGLIALIIVSNVNAQSADTYGQKIEYGSNSKAGK